MPTSLSREAYDDCYEILDRAISAERVADRCADATNASRDQRDPAGEIAVARSGLRLRTCGSHCAVPFRF